MGHEFVNHLLLILVLNFLSTSLGSAFQTFLNIRLGSSSVRYFFASKITFGVAVSLHADLEKFFNNSIGSEFY